MDNPKITSKVNDRGNRAVVRVEVEDHPYPCKHIKIMCDRDGDSMPLYSSITFDNAVDMSPANVRLFAEGLVLAAKIGEDMLKNLTEQAQK